MSVSLLLPNRMAHPAGMIGIPAGEQARWSEFMRSLLLLKRPQGSQISFVYGAYIEAGRNELVKQTLASDAQWLFMVDDDHVFERQLLMNLLDRDVDVVGALSLPRKPPYFVCAFEESNSVTGISRGIGVHELRFEMQKVAAVGTGAILIRRHVLEAIEPPWFDTVRDETGGLVSEDVTFCEKAREAGFGVWLDATQSIGHLTGVAVYLEQRGVKIELGPEDSIVIPFEQITEVAADASQAEAKA